MALLFYVYTGRLNMITSITWLFPRYFWIVSGRARVWHTHYQNKAGHLLATRVVNRKFSVGKYHLKSYARSRITRKRVPTKAVPINLDLITNFLSHKSTKRNILCQNWKSKIPTLNTYSSRKILVFIDGISRWNSSNK